MSTPNRFHLTSDRQRRNSARRWFIGGAAFGLILGALAVVGPLLYLQRQTPEPFSRACMMPQKDHEVTLFKMDDGKIDCWRFQ